MAYRKMSRKRSSCIRYTRKRKTSGRRKAKKGSRKQKRRYR